MTLSENQKNFDKEAEQEEINLARLLQKSSKKRRKGKKKETFNDFVNRIINEDISYV